MANRRRKQWFQWTSQCLCFCLFQCVKHKLSESCSLPIGGSNRLDDPPWAAVTELQWMVFIENSSFWIVPQARWEIGWTGSNLQGSIIELQCELATERIRTKEQAPQTQHAEPVRSPFNGHYVQAPSLWVIFSIEHFSSENIFIRTDLPALDQWSWILKPLFWILQHTSFAYSIYSPLCIPFSASNPFESLW